MRTSDNRQCHFGSCKETASSALQRQQFLLVEDVYVVVDSVLGHQH